MITAFPSAGLNWSPTLHPPILATAAAAERWTAQAAAGAGAGAAAGAAVAAFGCAGVRLPPLRLGAAEAAAEPKGASSGPP
jgi:hypothetical protein